MPTFKCNYSISIDVELNIPYDELPSCDDKWSDEIPELLDKEFEKVFPVEWNDYKLNFELRYYEPI